MILGFYVLLILLLAFVGYQMGKKQGKAEMYAGVGALAGAIISVLLWQFWGKNNATY